MISKVVARLKGSIFMKKRRLLLAFVISSFLTLLVGLLSNLAATYLAPAWADKPWIVYVALALTFIVSLVVSSYAFLKTLPETKDGDSISTQSPLPPLGPPGSYPVQIPSSQLPGKSYRELIGRDILIGSVMAALRDPSGKWVVAVDGMGGIGKTALAREIAERCTSEHLFDAVVWDQAPKESQGLPIGKSKGKGKGTLTFETVLDSIARQLGALDVPRLKGSEKELRVKGLLQAHRVLVVLDNLETAKELQNEIVRRLLPLLSPGKALMTSRHRFQGEVYAVHLSGLDEDGSLRFIRQEAQEKNIQNVSKANISELKQIAVTTGGSPLALKLVVGQLGHLPLSAVLEQLRDVKLPKGDSDKNDYARFYKGIFSPSWKLLSDDGKNLLISMSHFAPGIGGTYEAVKATSDLADDILNYCIDELWKLSFLEKGDSPNLKKARYYLHALTQYFVLSDIVKVI
jgi:hypothetical protein